MTTNNSTKPLTTKEAAEYLRMPIGNLYKLTCSGRIRHFKPTGGRIYFRQEDLDEFISKGLREADYHLDDRAICVAYGDYR